MRSTTNLFNLELQLVANQQQRENHESHVAMIAIPNQTVILRSIYKILGLYLFKIVIYIVLLILYYRIVRRKIENDPLNQLEVLRGKKHHCVIEIKLILMNLVRKIINMIGDLLLRITYEYQ